MTWTQVGFNFRGSSGFVTDNAGANETYVLGSNDQGGSDTYPQTRVGATFGWDFNAIPIDRDSTVDRRLAGLNYVPGGSTGFFRVDLPATGTYDIRLAMGDTGFDHTSEFWYIEIFDNTTSEVIVLNHASGTAQDNYYDATATILSEANWPGSNTKITKTFTSTICKVQVGNGIASSNTMFTHMDLTQASSFDPTTAVASITPGVQAGMIGRTARGIYG